MNYPFEEWAEQNLTVQSRNGAEWTVLCFNNPDHQDNHPSCSFNVEEGCWLCHSCGDKGSLKGRDEFDEAGFRTKMLLARLNKMRSSREQQDQVSIRVPESTLRRYNVKTNFWNERGLNEDTQKMFGLGFDTIANAGTIPIRTATGALTGVTRRFLDPESVGTKYKYPRNFKAAQSVFASWMCEEFDMSTVVKTEGSIDAMRCWQVGYPAVALYGNSVSPTHVQILLEMGVKKFIDFSDNDEGGERARERSFGYWLSNKGKYEYKPETDLSSHFRMLNITQFFGVKDAGSMTDEQVEWAIESADRYTISRFVQQKRYVRRRVTV